MTTANQAEQSYAGDVDSRQALEILRDSPNAVLVDVRSAPEWEFVGRPDLSDLGRDPVLISWQTFPGMTRNPDFISAVRAAGVREDQVVLLLCRSGQRSKHAAIALTEDGYQHCFNISDGFEGPKDAAGHRNTVSGWRASGLPWAQG
jgi:rhodanese-related sulfurtransferase